MTASTLLTLLVMLCAGVVIGALSGLLGIGGGTIIIPILRLAFGLDALVATATSLFTIIPTTLSGMAGHVRSKTINIRAGLVIGLAGCIMSPIGSWLSQLAGGTIVIVTASLAILYTAVTMIRKGISSSQAPARTSGDDASVASDASNLPETVLSAKGFNKKTLAKLVATGLIAGLLSGFIGLGGGFLIVPILTLVLGFPMTTAAGTSLLAVAILAVPGTVAHAFMGHVAYIEGIVLACGSIPGAFLGGVLAKKVPDKMLRLLFGILLALVGIVLIVNEFGYLG